MAAVALAISACGSASSADDMADKGAAPADPTEAGVDTHPIYNSGELSSVVPASVADVQTRVAAQLEAGLPSAAFDGLRRPEESLFRIGGQAGSPLTVDRVGDGYRYYLVGRHLEPTQEASLCEAGGSAYTGYIAARPFLRSEFHAEAMMVTEAFPYGLIVCDSGDDELALEVVSHDHPALGDFEMPALQFMEGDK